MTNYFPNPQLFSPVRPLNWRWQRAEQLIREHRYFSRRRDDAETGRAIGYLHALGRCRTDRHIETLVRRFPDVHAARQIHENGGATAIELQGRVLAGQTDDQIARATGLFPEVISRYEALHFHCRDRLDARGWIVTHAIKWLSFDPARGRDFATVAKAFAYYGGPILLEAIVPFIRGEKSLDPPAADRLVPESESDRSIRLAVTIDMLPWNLGTVIRVGRIHMDLLAKSEHPYTAVLAGNVLLTPEIGAGDALEDVVESRPATHSEAQQGHQRLIA